MIDLSKILEAKNVVKTTGKRVYKFTKKDDLNVWMDSLRSQLETLELIDVIDEAFYNAVSSAAPELELVQ